MTTRKEIMDELWGGLITGENVRDALELAVSKIELAARRAALTEAAEICKGKQVVFDNGEWKLQKPINEFDARWHGDIYAAAIERARDG